MKRLKTETYYFLISFIVTSCVIYGFFGVCAAYLSRASDRTVPLILISVGVILILFALIPFPGKRKKYGALIRQVTGDPRAKKEDGPAKKPEEEPVYTEKEKYKFRVTGRKK